MPVDFNYFLNRKFAIQQQQANDGSRNAATNALAAGAAANLDQTRARLLPNESRANIGLTQANTGLAQANIGLTRANTNLTSNQAAVVIPEAQARIRNTNANTDFTDTQQQVLEREGLVERNPGLDSFRSVLGGRLPTIGGQEVFSLGGLVGGQNQRRRSGETEVAYLDRINGIR